MRLCTIPIIAMIMLIMLSATGCAPALREAEASLARAEIVLAELQSREQQAMDALDAAKRIADATGSETAQQAVAIASRTLEALQDALPQASDAVELARSAVASAESVASGRIGIGQAVMGIVLSLVTGGGAAIYQAARARRWLDVARHVAEVGQAFKHIAEAEDVDVSDIINLAMHDQRVAGIKGDVERVLYE